MHDKNLAHFLQLLFVLNHKQLKTRGIYLINDLTYLYRNLFGSKSQQMLKRNHKSRNGITEMKPGCLISHIYIHAHTHSQETITLNKIIINYIVIVCLFLKNMLKYCIEILTCPFSPCNLDGKYTKSMYNYVPVLNIFTIYIINVHQYFFQHLFKYIQ